MEKYTLIKDGKTQCSRRVILPRLIFKFRGISIEIDKLIENLYRNTKGLE